MKTPNVAFTVRSDLCTGCGICAGACISKAIDIKEEEGLFKPSIDTTKCKNEYGCHRCLDVCPGVGINLAEEAKELFPIDSFCKNKIDPHIGTFSQTYVGYSNNHDLRFHSASGGTLSQFLIFLLENGIIDGAIVSKFDPKAPLKVKSFIARTKEDIICAKGSKYAPVSLHDAIVEIKTTECRKLVIVGVPCQIEGLRKLISLDKKIQEKVCGLFSLYCSGSRSFYFTEYVMKERNIDLNKLSYLAYRDNGCLGGLVAKGENLDYYEDYQSYCHPLRSLFYPHRCILCADHFGELSDISFGDIHTPPYSDDKIGINSIIVRTAKWGNLLRQAANSEFISLKKIAYQDILKSQKMAYVKKKRNLTFSLIEKKLGKAVPDFGSNYNARITPKSIIDYIQISLQRFIGKRKWLWWIIPFIKAKVKIH